MTTLFISDLHLSGERPGITQLFQDFLRGEARQAEALYILGDLFEVWLGDDAVSPDIAPILDELSGLTGSGVPLFVMVGNRDFLLGEDFAKMTGCTLLPDPTVIDLYGTQTLLMHGDTLCTDDRDYQQFRQMVRDPAWQRDFLGKPIAERIRIGREARAESRARTREKPEQIMDTNAEAVAEAFRQHHVAQLIHGHTHRPAIHELTINGQAVKRIVLGDWYQQGSILRVDANGLELSELTASN
jgi:UDP-2,3-diacylglucosamine hydrolase